CVVDLTAGGLGHRRGEILNLRADGVDLGEVAEAPGGVTGASPRTERGSATLGAGPSARKL
ncbi:MAG: hypothetical protein ABW214_01110, partial [Terrimicrobiaceae bacterium]